MNTNQNIVNSPNNEFMFICNIPIKIYFLTFLIMLPIYSCINYFILTSLLRDNYSISILINSLLLIILINCFLNIPLTLVLFFLYKKYREYKVRRILQNCYTTIEISENNSCPICLDEYDKKYKIVKLNLCNHTYHQHCIDNWLKINLNCPLCRICMENI